MPFFSPSMDSLIFEIIEDQKIKQRTLYEGEEALKLFNRRMTTTFFVIEKNI